MSRTLSINLEMTFNTRRSIGLAMAKLLTTTATTTTRTIRGRGRVG